MPRHEEEPMSRIHIQVFNEDLKILEAIYGQDIGISKAIRRIIRAFLETNKGNLTAVPEL